MHILSIDQNIIMFS